MPDAIQVIDRGLADYELIWRDMREYTDARDADSPDQIWFVQHPPVYTLGANCRDAPRKPGIKVVKSDRGGQITYHAPGQLIAYLLLDLKRRKLGPKLLVQRIEQSVLDLLGEFDLAGARKDGAPGIYVDGEKIAALGLRIRRGCCYHGLSLNARMDLRPFADIDPCGFPNLGVTSLAAHGVRVQPPELQQRLATHLLRAFGAA